MNDINYTEDVWGIKEVIDVISDIVYTKHGFETNMLCINVAYG